MEFKAAFGDQTKTVEITAPFGNNGILHLYIDKHYYGQIIKRLDKWDLREQNHSFITAADRDILLEIVEQNFK